MFVTRESLAGRVEALRKRGVRFPAIYPYENLDEDPVSVRSTLAVVEVLECLVAVHDGKAIVVEPGIPGGDVDILVEGSPPLHLQVKDLASMTRDKGGLESQVLELMEATKRDLVVEHEKHPGETLFSPVLIHKSADGLRAYTGTTMRVVREKPPAHVIVIELGEELAREIAAKKVIATMKKAAGQIPHGLGALRVPVLNLARYPADQDHIYNAIGAHLQTHGKALKIAGVLLVFARGDPVNGSQLEAFAVPIPNPHLPEGEQLRGRHVTTKTQVELQQHRAISLDIRQLHHGAPEQLRFVGDKAYLGDDCLGTLPGPPADGVAVIAAPPGASQRVPDDTKVLPPPVGPTVMCHALIFSL